MACKSWRAAPDRVEFAGVLGRGLRVRWWWWARTGVSVCGLLATAAPVAAQTASPTPHLDPATVDTGDNSAFIRSRIQLNYDKTFSDPGYEDRVRLIASFAFGDRKQFGISTSVPYGRNHTQRKIFQGFGDARVKTSWRFFDSDTVSQALAFAVQMRTATYQPQLGGASTLLIPQYAVNVVLTDILVFTGQVTYVKGAHPRTRFVDIETLTVEPMLTFELPEDWFITFDPKLSWSLSHRNRAQHQFRYTLGRVFGKNDEWQASVYGQTALSDDAADANARQIFGASITRFF